MNMHPMNALLLVSTGIVGAIVIALAIFAGFIKLRAHWRMKASEKEVANDLQRRSFAYGNTTISNPAITRETVNRVANEHDNPRSDRA